MPIAQKFTYKIWIACLLAIVGTFLLIAGFIVPPLGMIHSSVLVAFGEVFSFVGALMGIDYHFKYELYKLSQRKLANVDNSDGVDL